jgi:hypothetical protein
MDDDIVAIKTIIHSVDTNSHTAIISVIDEDGYVVAERQNRHVELDEDLVLNSTWLLDLTKYVVMRSRLDRLDRAENDLV